MTQQLQGVVLYTPTGEPYEAKGGGGGGSAEEVKIKGSEGHLAKVTTEGKLEVTGGGGGEVEGKGAAGSPPSGKPVLMGGSDGTDVRTLSTNSSGHLEVNAVKSTEGASAVGAVASGNPVQLSGVDGESKVRRLLTSSTGKLEVSGAEQVEGKTKAGEATTENPVFVGGKQTGTGFVTPILIAAGGEVYTISEISGGIEGKAASESAVSGNPVLIAGEHAGDVKTVEVLSTGELVAAIGQVEGGTPSGSAATKTPVLIAGSDGTDVRTLKTNSLGSLEVLGAATGGAVYGPTAKLMAVGGTDGTDARILRTDSEGHAGTVKAPSNKRVGAVRKFSVKASSEEVIPESTSRGGLSIQNIGTEPCYLGLGEAAVLEDDMELEPGASWNGEISSKLWIGSVFAIAKSTNAKLAVIQVE